VKGKSTRILAANRYCGCVLYRVHKTFVPLRVTFVFNVIFHYICRLLFKYFEKRFLTDVEYEFSRHRLKTYNTRVVTHCIFFVLAPRHFGQRKTSPFLIRLVIIFMFNCHAMLLKHTRDVRRNIITQYNNQKIKNK